MNPNKLQSLASFILVISLLVFLSSIVVAYSEWRLPLAVTVTAHILVMLAATGVKIGYVIRLTAIEKLVS